MASKHVLIVDDNVEFLEEMIEALSTHGYKITALSDEMQTLETIRQVQPDVLLVDIKMKEKTGVQLAVEIRNVPEMARLPIIMMTGYYAQTEVKRFMGLEIVQEFVLKPIQLDILLKKIETVYRADVYASREAGNAAGPENEEK